MVRVKKTDEKEDEGMELSEEDIEALSQGTKIMKPSLQESMSLYTVETT